MSKDRILYLFSIVVSVIIVSVMFLAWNMSSVSKIDITGKHATNLKWHVEDCNISKEYISIKGWAYLANLGRVTVKIYVEDKKGGYQKLNKNSFHVPGVNESLGLSPYELPGFFAVKRIIGTGNYTGKFMIEAVDSQGNESYATYECK